MQNLGRLALLFDFYGGLLTARQRRTFELRYGQDLSLGEIAQEDGLSRPAVSDLIRRAERTLFRAEASCGMVERWQREQTFLTDLRDLLEGGGPKALGEARDRLRNWLDEGGDDVV